MKEEIQAVFRTPAGPGSCERIFTEERAEEACAFHKSFPEYAPTPLVELQELARTLGVAGISVKDESYRFGLNAFKVLGGSYCIGRCLADRLGVDLRELPYDRLTGREVREALGPLTFVTATDGNHGRGIAWTANRLGHGSVVYMPKGSARERLENIRALGADASITELNYDDTVRYASMQAEKNGWVLVQDTSWDGYEKIPTWIMQGYTTMAYEAVRQLKERPTHIFLQAGVGAMAGALTGFFADYYGADLPTITVVEPNKANCVYRTAEAMDGTLHKVDGPMDTIMAGLSCGEPCGVGWRQLRAHAKAFVSIPDFVAAKGMRILASPVGGDRAVVSGESGAATLGFVAEVLQNEGLHALRDQLGLGPDARILCISTEGDTDRDNYRRIVWDGAYPSAWTE